MSRPAVTGRDVWTWREDVCRDRHLLPAARLVAMRLSFHVKPLTGTCYPSQTTLAAELAMHRSRVQRHVAELIDCGWLDYDRTPRVGAVTHYRLTRPEPDLLGRQVADSEPVLLRRHDLSHCVDTSGPTGQTRTVHDHQGNGQFRAGAASADATAAPADKVRYSTRADGALIVSLPEPAWSPND